MLLQTLVVALVAILLGLAFTLAGYKFFRVLIPLWGFFTGWMWGASVITTLLGQGFLSTVTGWAVGLASGLILAALAYFFYYVAVVLLGASVGYALGAGLMAGLGFDSTFLLALVGILTGVLLAILVIVLGLPKVLLVVLAALGGAAALLAGTMLLLGIIPLNSLNMGTLGAVVTNSWLWLIAYIALVVVGVVAQMRTTADYTLHAWGGVA
jgi:hypothetical protein